VRRADRSPLKFNAKLSRPFSNIPIRLSTPYYDPTIHTHTAEGTNLQNAKAPQTWKQVLKSPNRAKWLQAIYSEFEQIILQNTLEF
jgi:hypothetical protein